MTVTVSDYYVPGCQECCAEIERITRAAIRDFSVTKLTFTPGHRHNHEVEKPAGALTAPQRSDAPTLPLLAVNSSSKRVTPSTGSTMPGWNEAVITLSKDLGNGQMG